MTKPDESRGCDLAFLITGRKAKWNVNEKIEGARARGYAIGIIAGWRSIYNSYLAPPMDAGAVSFPSVSCFDFNFQNFPSFRVPPSRSRLVIGLDEHVE